MRLSLRAKAYLWSCTVANVIMAVLLIGFADSFQTGSFEAMKSLMPLSAWGVCFFLVSCATLWGAIHATEKSARLGLMANLAVTGGFFAGFIAASVQGMSTGPSGIVAWGLLAVINGIMLGNPLRTPFEDLVREITEEAA